MKGKVVIVTGGGSGLGFAMAKKFAEKEARTIIIGRDKEKLEKAALKIGLNIEPLVFDLEKLSEIPSLISQIIEKYGCIDVLVNNAGVHLKKDLLEVTDKEFGNVQQVNLLSVFSLTREVAKIMAQRENGAILNISSMASQYGIPKVIAYTASKSAVEGMTRAMAVELSPLGIRVNCIAPGFIESAMSLKALNNDPERKAKVLGRTPLGKLGQPEDVANAACFLCSDEAAFITGVVMPVDGGNAIGF